MIQTNTTHRHYEKYARMARLSQVTLKDSTTFDRAVARVRGVEKDHDIVGGELTDLLNKFTRLSTFDAYFGWTRWSYKNLDGPKSLAENVCMYKHLIAYELLGAVPAFTDEEEV